ncbi:MAG: MEKHLA domain-containing protein [Betaproteobacteria bacterium]|nr:MEKHLA domain-containing protein [Betaproteobacteria bacterium]
MIEPGRPGAVGPDAFLEALRASYVRWTGRTLLPRAIGPDAARVALFEAPFALLAHDAQPDPLFCYGNRQALALFETTFEAFTALPSRLSAEPARQEERAALLDRVTRHGFVDDYRGIRITRTGRRFLISDATIWNIVEAQGRYCGQAALIRKWQALD